MKYLIDHGAEFCHSKEHVVLVLSYSDFIEVGKLKDTTANYIIEFLEVIERAARFSRHCLPDVLVTDNGPQ